MTSVVDFSRRGQAASAASRALRAEARRQQVLALHVAGMKGAEIARMLGVSKRTVYGDLGAMQDTRIRLEEVIEDAGIDAADIHLTLSKMHDADLADIAENPNAPIEQVRYKPIGQWPAIWRQGLAGKIKLTPVTLPDGERTPGGDQVRYRVEIERADILKILELAARLKAVNAMVQPNGDTNINVTISANEQRLERARKRLKKAGEAEVVEIEAKEVEEGDSEI